MNTWSDPAAMWDERFSKAEPVYGQSPNAYLRGQTARLAAGMRVLVPGDGYGRNGIWLAQQGFRVHTVDVSSVGVERARRTSAAAGVELQIENANLTNWNWPEEQYDAVASVFLHLFPGDRPAVHGRMLRSLKPGGIIILEAFTPGQLQFTSGGPKAVELLYTANLLREDFGEAEIVELQEEIVDLDEGQLHKGKASVVHGVFCRK